MPSYQHPGVYVEEIPSGSKPIEGVGTSTAAFVGKATKGPVGEAKLVQSFDDYNNIYGDIASEEDAMGLAVQSFYLNGGKAAFICRLAANGSIAASKTVDGQGGSVDAVLKISASSKGVWGNKVYFRIIKPDQDSLTFDLEVGHHDKGKFVVDEEFKGLSMRADDDDYALKQVNDKSAYIELSLEDNANPEETAEKYEEAILTGGELDETDDNYFSVPFASSAPPTTLVININSLGAKLITLDLSAFETSLAVAHVADAKSLAYEIKKAVKALGVEAAYQDFECEYRVDHFEFKSLEPDDAKEKTSASIQITDGDLARLLRIDSKQPAVLTGGPGVSASIFNGDYFEANITGEVTLEINIDNHGTETIRLKADDMELDGVNQGDGDKVALAIQNAVQALNPSIVSYKDFKCEYIYSGSVPGRKFSLTSGSKSARDSDLSVNAPSLGDILRLDTGNTASTLPGRSVNQGTGKVIPLHDLGTLDEGLQLEDGKENPAMANDFTDFYNSTLRKVRDVSIILVPGQSWADDGSGNPIVSATLAHCQTMKSRVVIIDPPKELELDQAKTVNDLALPSSTYSVLYYPWVKVANPFSHAETNPTAAKTVDVAPSSFAAGMWSRIDGKRGVWKAPAGMETGLVGASGLKYIIEDGEQDQLNPLGVNCFRNMPGGGRVIWGSRTLATKADPEWRYVPVRRTAIMIEQSIYNGIQWAVFEPNDHRLWSALRGNIDNFMNGLFRVGAFQGKKASDAYFVRCGLGDTMTQGDIDAGQVIVVVGFAPLKPAEFVIVRIQQKVNQQ